MATTAVWSAKVAVADSGEAGRSAVYSIEELLERKISTSSLESREYGRIGIHHAMWHPLSSKVGTNFADKQRSLSIVRSLAQATEFFFFDYNDEHSLEKGQQQENC
jgi:hypothetical protein